MARGPGRNTKRKAAKGPPQHEPRPAKRRAGAKQSRPQDVYEAEDSDPDELKNTKRYDQVDNYEYEMPSDFEDEEIDEELAFTSEDKRKFGGWFDDANASDQDAFSEGSDSELPDDEDGDVDDAVMKQGGQFRDGELDILYSDEELQAAPGTKRSSKRSKASQPVEDAEQELDSDIADEHEDDSDIDEGGEDDDEDNEDEEADEDDSFLNQLASDNEDDEDESDDNEDEDGDAGDDEKYRDMLASVLGSDKPTSKKGLSKLQQSVIDEAYPEAEFALNPGAASAGAGGELTLADLMAGLGAEGRKKLPATLRKELDRMSKGTKSQVVTAPLPRAIKERSERQAGYQMTSQEVSKWQPIVKANREAPTLNLTPGNDSIPRVNTTAAIVARHTPETAMESEVAALLAAAGAASATAVAAAEEALAVKELTLEEAKERRDRLAKMRSLLFYHELKAKRLKNIKSKEYRKKAAKAAKRQADRALLAGGDADEAAQADQQAREQAEFERAKERLTLKHRNSSRWVRRALKRGATLADAGTRAAIAEQLRLGEALRKRIEGGKGDSDEDSDSDTDRSVSGDEGDETTQDVARGSGVGMSSKARALAMDILSGGGPAEGEEEAPKKGLFALPFMARALERKKQAAMLEANAMLQQADNEENGHGANGGAQSLQGRRKFGAGAGTDNGHNIQPSDEDVSDSDMDEDAEAKAERLQKRLAGTEDGKAAETAKRAATSKPRKTVPSAADEADLDRALGIERKTTTITLHPPTAHANGHTHNVPSHANISQNQASSSQQPVNNEPNSFFIPAKTFEGVKPGYAFKKGKKGLGYYLDNSPAMTPQQKRQQKRQQQAAAKGNATETVQIAGENHPPNSQIAKQPAPSKHPPSNKQHEQQVAEQQQHDDSSDEDVDRGVGNVEGMRPTMAKLPSQAELIAMAFAGDDVEAEFEAEKAKDVAAELPNIEEPSSLPGWGAWSAQQRDPKWMKDAKAKAERERQKAAAGRADSKKQFVVISEKYDRKAMGKYTASDIPFPYDSRETYERSMRQPLGRQYNPDAAFRDLTRPAVLKNTGAIIAPIKYTKPLAKQAAEITGNAHKPKVLTVSGGVMKLPKKATKH